MPPSSRPHVNRYVPSDRFPIGIKWLLIANVGIFLVGFILRFSLVETLLRNLALVPSDVVQRFQVWEVVTYLFVHGSSIMLILWNMLALWMFGAELERLWGTVKFLRFYLSCGVIAALAVIVCAYLFGGPDILTIGSSAAINGVLVAYGLMFPNNTIIFAVLHGGQRWPSRRDCPRRATADGLTGWFSAAAWTKTQRPGPRPHRGQF